MGRELQKRKRRSSRAKVRPPNHRKKVLNPSGNNTVAQNWDKNLTLSQNYSRFGLVAKLGVIAGGVEKKPGSSRKPTAPRQDPFAVRPTAQAVIGEAKVERDADGKLVRIVRPGRDDNPLHDALNQFDSDNEDDGDGGDDGDDAEEWGGIEGDTGPQAEVARALEEEANQPTEKAHRYQSARELEWLQRLADRHGADTAAMARDRKLNPMQQTGAELARRLRKAGLLAS